MMAMQRVLTHPRHIPAPVIRDILEMERMEIVKTSMNVIQVHVMLTPPVRTPLDHSHVLVMVHWWAMVSRAVRVRNEFSVFTFVLS